MRLCWHGFPDSFASYLDLEALDRFLANDALDWLIDADPGPRPSELR